MSPLLRPDVPLVTVRTRAAWRSWLERNHAVSAGV